ncbi:rare lipoprotein A [Paracidovorax anthurii]|uniref:Endolytic peptidoglycan transglycosylase RlpA n=2 Tax=Paracidovorax anthurii TaxID=78229 RepID=A0A328YVX2_9BURK|nr:septal ring lytic transglycosylase RlpA family protein [Paracidovorax anthurii]RAR77293.1 rare lipoprotein A [Paracidovorax anthurii]
MLCGVLTACAVAPAPPAEPSPSPQEKEAAAERSTQPAPAAPEKPARPSRPAAPRPPQDAAPADSGAKGPAEGQPARDAERDDNPDLADFEEEGMASWYGARFHSRRTASGERFDMNDFTAAHRTLPFGTRVCVRSLVTGRSVQVRINDRGPHSPGRIVDLSRAAAQSLGLLGLGIKPVALSVAPADPDLPCPGS